MQKDATLHHKSSRAPWPAYLGPTGILSALMARRFRISQSKLAKLDLESMTRPGSLELGAPSAVCASQYFKYVSLVELQQYCLADTVIHGECHSDPEHHLCSCLASITTSVTLALIASVRPFG